MSPIERDAIFELYLYVQVVAIIDIDCAELEGFDEMDKKYLEDLAKVLAYGSDF
jgi:putative methionine-R-sulfoxide reductase with GAF domain